MKISSELSPITPHHVIKQAFAARILADGQIGIDMLDRRNLMSPVYDETIFAEMINVILHAYLPAFAQLENFLKEHGDV